MGRFENARKAKVKAVNRCHVEAMKLYDLLMPIFRTLEGQCLDKKDGTFLAKVAKLLPEIETDHGLHIHRASGQYSLAYTVKTNESIEGDHGCLYYGIGVYFGDTTRGTLENLKDRPEYRTDYTDKELLEKRDDCKAKKNAYEEAKSACWPFGEEYDD